jgi:hypothetical protein
MLAPFDKAGELFASGLCPLHERFCGALEVTTVMFHADRGALKVA